MESFTDFSVLFPGSRIEIFNDTTLKSVAREINSRNLPLRERPLMITDVRAELKLFYNEHALERYRHEQMSFEELKSSSWCDGLYRNKTKLMTTDKDEIETESLFLRRGDEIILFDGDKFHTGTWNTASQLFYEIG